MPESQDAEQGIDNRGSAPASTFGASAGRSDNWATDDGDFKGREVSCRSLGILFDGLEKKGISPETFSANSGYAAAHLQEKNERISWDGYLALMANAGEIWDDDELIELGLNFFRSPFARPIGLVARLLYTPLDFYRTAAKPGIRSGRTMSCIDSFMQVLEPDLLLHTLTLYENYDPSREFWLISKGVLMAMPTVMGLPKAQVEMTVFDRGAQYLVRIPSGGGWLAGLRRALTWPFTVRSAAVALEEANVELQKQYLRLQGQMAQRQRVEAELESLVSELEQKNEALERFTYSVSHDLKSPLITISGFLGFLRQDIAAGNSDRIVQDIARIQDATTRMHTLLDELLQLSRIGLETNPPQLTSFNTLVEEALHRVAGRIDEGNVQVTVMADMPQVYVDHLRLVEVLQNLLDNAAKFMGDQAHPHIEVGCERQATRTLFFVRDNGIGIESKYFEEIFGLFNRLDHTIEGTGIGLTLIKRIIVAHNCEIWPESNGKGAGTTFFFTLPLGPKTPI